MSSALQQIGNYRLLKHLGSGGQASVYLGEHLLLKRRSAIKILHTSLDEQNSAIFLREAQILASLNHPHIIRLHDFTIEQGEPLLVMDYAPGGTLRACYPTGQPLPLEILLTYLTQIASALQYAHDRGIIHRDIKPENLLLDEQQQIKLSDFGLALLAPSPEQLKTQELIGTVFYMAPEQLRGKPGFASDQYALGILLYEWLCGERPFPGEVSIEAKRFLESGIKLVECPNCASTRTLSPRNGVLRFPSHDKRKTTTPNAERRWAMRETIWKVVGGERT